MTYRQLRTACLLGVTVLSALWLQYEVVTDETVPWVSYVEPLPAEPAQPPPPSGISHVLPRRR